MNNKITKAQLLDFIQYVNVELNLVKDFTQAYYSDLDGKLADKPSNFELTIDEIPEYKSIKEKLWLIREKYKLTSNILNLI